MKGYDDANRLFFCFKAELLFNSEGYSSTIFILIKIYI